MKRNKITKDMTFMELMELDSEAAGKLAERGLFCGGCPMAQFETIEGGAVAHGVPLDKLLRELNEGGSSSEMTGGSSTLSKGGSASPGACEDEEGEDE